ncbi:Clp protease N-terminal domain-containing protein [Actinomadura adrarensis]|uniref:Clp protease N-terminal domain-containing protein n=1 Tax=Actinomadura adrarensis TaxID=1819600 RepID=A0ABW3CPJ0_9ACTN
MSDGHVLLGLLHDEDTRAVRLLRSRGVDVQAVRDEITRSITSRAA